MSVTPQQSQSLVADQRTVVSRVQQVSCVCVSDDGCVGNGQPSVVNSDVCDDLLQTQCVAGNKLAWIIRDAVCVFIY